MARSSSKRGSSGRSRSASTRTTAESTSPPERGLARRLLSAFDRILTGKETSAPDAAAKPARDVIVKKTPRKSAKSSDSLTPKVPGAKSVGVENTGAKSTGNKKTANKKSAPPIVPTGDGEENGQPSSTSSAIQGTPGVEPSKAGQPSSPPRPRIMGVAGKYAKIVEETLEDLRVPAQVVHAEVGPTLIRLGLVPGYLERGKGKDARRERVRANKIVARQNDLALALGVKSLRIEAPVPGKPYMGIEVPNPSPKPVALPALLAEAAFEALVDRAVLPMAFGREVAGQPVLADLARLPHLLVAGATGSGKSVAVNALIGTILMTRQPSDARIIVVDPKRVEFNWLDGVPHLLTPVVTETEDAVETLGKVETEMARRYDLLAEAGCRNRLAYNDGRREPMPALVVVVDELADLMMLASNDVERSICRVAQLGRAAGIHLVVATQRPSVDVITGLIKANLPARLAFAVSSYVDSRTILDAPGADQLLGRGDFLYLAPDAMKPVRGQGAMARDSFLNRAVKGAIKAREEAIAKGEFTGDVEAERFKRLLSAQQIAEDKLYNQACELAEETDSISASFLQRKLRIGYPRAMALIERLRADGIIDDPNLDAE